MTQQEMLEMLTPRQKQAVGRRARKLETCLSCHPQKTEGHCIVRKKNRHLKDGSQELRNITYHYNGEETIVVWARIGADGVPIDVNFLGGGLKKS